MDRKMLATLPASVHAYLSTPEATPARHASSLPALEPYSASGHMTSYHADDELGEYYGAVRVEADNQSVASSDRSRVSNRSASSPASDGQATESGLSLGYRPQQHIATGGIRTAVTSPTSVVNSPYYTTVTAKQHQLEPLQDFPSSQGLVYTGGAGPEHGRLHPLLPPTVIDIRKPPPPLPSIPLQGAPSSVINSSGTATITSPGMLTPGESHSAYPPLKNTAITGGPSYQTVHNPGVQIQPQPTIDSVRTYPSIPVFPVVSLPTTVRTTEGTHFSVAPPVDTHSFTKQRHVPADASGVGKLVDGGVNQGKTKRSKTSRDVEKPEKKLKEAFMHAISRQGLDILEMAEIADIGENMELDELIHVVQHGLSNIDPDYYRRIIEARGRQRDGEQGPVVAVSPPGETGDKSLPVPEEYEESPLPKLVSVPSSRTSPPAIKFPVIEQDESSSSTVGILSNPLPGKNGVKRKSSYFESDFKKKDFDCINNNRETSRKHQDHFTGKQYKERDCQGQPGSAEEHSRASHRSRSPWRKSSSGSPKQMLKSRSRSRSPRKRDSERGSRYGKRRDSGSHSTGHVSDYRRQTGSRCHRSDHTHPRENSKSTRPNVGSKDHDQCLTRRKVSPEKLRKDAALTLPQPAAVDTNDHASAMPAAHPANEGGPRRAENGGKRWSGVLSRFLIQMQRLDPEKLAGLTRGDQSGAEVLFSLFDNDVREALPRDPREQSEFLADLQNLVRSFQQANQGSDVTSRLTNKRIAGFEDGGPQAKRRSDERYGGGSSATMESTLYHCHLCNKSYSNTADFEVHMQSDTHRATSDAYARMHAQQTEQQIQRMRATQHLKDVENDESEKCRICVKTLLIPYEQHCMLKEHQHKAKLVKKGCILCKTGSFANYQLYKEHIDLESHKKAKDELNRSKQSKEEATESASNGRAEPEEVKKPTDDRKAEKEESQAVKEAKQNKEKKREASGEKRDQAKPAREQEQKATKPEAVLEPEVDVYEDSAYDPDVAVGQGHVVAVKGFFCKLCHKFYRSEELAKVVHCKSQSHFAKYQEFIISQQQENDSSTMDDKIDAPSAKAERQANLTEHKVHKTSGNPPTDKKSSSPRYPTARRGRRR